MSAALDLRHRDRLAPLPPGPDRPRWSVMIPTYRNATTLGATIASVLAEPASRASMQIEVVDDASDDDAEGVTRAIGAGRVAFHRHPRNLGHVGNFHACLTRARGEIVHLLHGDDLVRPGFYEALGDAFSSDPKLGAAFCRSVYVDAEGEGIGIQEELAPRGILADAAAFLAAEQRIMTPSIAVRRRVYEELGGFDKRLRCAEDWEMWVRIAARFPVWHEPRALAAYRIHDASNTGRHVLSGGDAAANRAAITIFSRYLPDAVAAGVARRARRTYSASAVGTALKLWEGGHRIGAAAQICEAYRLAPGVALREIVRATVRKVRAHADA